ncbi:MAG: dihydropyrimidinase [Clostridia bacterium]|nr:dihydropyrimidinase [Clostridia bacterium]
MTTLIRGGTIVTDEGLFKGDILIRDGKIAEISGRADADEVIDAAGKYVLPGAVDIHTHMDLDVGIARVIDDFYTGTVAAACGGTTTIVDHMAFGPKGCSPWHQVREYHRLADGVAAVDYGFHGVLQHVDDAVLDDMAQIAADEGITSFKIYMTYDYRLDDLDLMKVLSRAEKEGILIAAHCENHGMVTYFRERFVREGKTQARWHPVSRPAEAEAEAVNRLLYLARASGDAPVYVVHLSTRAGLEEIRKARAAGQRHFGAETCPQYLLLDEKLYDDPQQGLKALMAPPLRAQADRDALWEALTNDELDTVATDHCPFTFARQKQQGAKDFTKCPSGAPGVEERLILMYSEGVVKGRITLPQLVKYACANPARVAGLYPRKGAITPGADADLVILDPDKDWVLTTDKLHGNADYTCYEGMPVRGRIGRVLLRGSTVALNGDFTGVRGGGRYLRRGRSALAL